MSKHVQKYPLHRFPALALPAGALLLSATAACVPGAEPETGPEATIDPSWTSGLDDVDLSPVTPAGDQWNTCPTWDCNKNHPMLTGFPVPEVNETGLPDDLKLRLMSFQQGTELLRLDVDRGEIKGYDKLTGVLEVEDASAIGSILTISNLEVTWRIRIEAYALMPYWVGSPRAYIPAYRLLYQRVGDSPSLWTNVCKAPAEPAVDPMWPGGFETYALLISDERYDRDAKKVRDDGNAEGWFNIACAGTALAKMVLMRFDPHIPPGVYHTTPDQRTATLKMLTADYLGIGEAFTVGGQPLQWASASGWHTVPVPGSSEAVWDADGAVCLDTPRLASTDPDIVEKIEAVCSSTPGCSMPRTCAQEGITAINWTQHGMWRTWNP
jgi:hypothetical protein